MKYNSAKKKNNRKNKMKYCHLQQHEWTQRILQIGETNSETHQIQLYHLYVESKKIIQIDVCF